LRQLRFFGYDAEKNPTDVGTNAKTTEVSAAVGLANLNYLDEALVKRYELSDLYFRELGDVDGLTFQEFDPAEYGYSYMPVQFKDESWLLRVLAALNEAQICPRRYFWSLLTDMSALAGARVVGGLQIAKDVSSRVLRLPLYPTLAIEDLTRIARLFEIAPTMVARFRSANLRI